MNIKNKKRVLTYVTAAALGLSSVATLTACGENGENKFPTIEENTVSKDTILSRYKFIKVQHRKTREIEYYLGCFCEAEKVASDDTFVFDNYYHNAYINVFNENEVIVAEKKYNEFYGADCEYDSDYDLLETYALEKYIKKYNMDKSEYTLNDFMELYNLLMSDEEIMGKDSQEMANETPSAITGKDKNQEPINTKRVDYNTLSECVLLQEHSNIDQSDKYYIAKKNQDVKLQDNSAVLTIVYTNLKDDAKIVEFERKKDSNNSDYSYTEVGLLSDYLLNYNYIQIDYTMNDVDTLLEKIVKDIAKGKQNSLALK